MGRLAQARRDCLAGQCGFGDEPESIGSPLRARRRLDRFLDHLPLAHAEESELRGVEHALEQRARLRIQPPVKHLRAVVVNEEREATLLVPLVLRFQFFGPVHPPPCTHHLDVRRGSVPRQLKQMLLVSGVATRVAARTFA